MSERILLDTNIFITGYRNQASPEGRVLNAVRNDSDAILLLSLALEDQVRRVARRIGGKDWTGLILSRIWHDFRVEYVSIPNNPLSVAEQLGLEIPREDWLIYLTAVEGRTTILISGNRRFLRQAAKQQSLFSCLTPIEFLAQLNHD